MAASIENHLKYANLQIAAEAFIATKNSLPGDTGYFYLGKDVLTFDNGRASKSTETQAQAYIEEGWTE